MENLMLKNIKTLMKSLLEDLESKFELAEKMNQET